MATPNRDLELWNKLTALPLDRLAEEPVPEIGFNKRLMREQKWDFATAIRVAAEYRRFLFLAQLGPVSPSERVDAAWHQHLTYTRAYNIGLCERTLGRPLDHTPSGGAADTAHYKSVYQDTLDRYRATFNEQAPKDIWPPLKTAVPVGKRENAFHATAKVVLSLVVLGAVFVWFSTRSAFLAIAMTGMVGIAMAMDHAKGEKRRSKDGSGCGGGCGAGSDSGGGDGAGCGSGCGGGCGGGCG